MSKFMSELGYEPRAVATAFAPQPVHLTIFDIACGVNLMAPTAWSKQPPSVQMWRETHKSQQLSKEGSKMVGNMQCVQIVNLRNEPQNEQDLQSSGMIRYAATVWIRHPTHLLYAPSINKQEQHSISTMQHATRYTKCTCCIPRLSRSPEGSTAG